jgi:hypothetical protein
MALDYSAPVDFIIQHMHTHGNGDIEVSFPLSLRNSTRSHERLECRRASTNEPMKPEKNP